jgi:hypothetical protein
MCEPYTEPEPREPKGQAVVIGSGSPSLGWYKNRTNGKGYPSSPPVVKASGRQTDAGLLHRYLPISELP